MNPLAAFFLNLRNSIDFPLRQWVHWKRSGFHLQNGSKEHLFAHLDPEKRRVAEQAEAGLRNQYHLDYLYTHSSADNYRENLYYLELLEKLLSSSPHPLANPLKVADIGPSHWFYVQAEQALLRWGDCPDGRQVSLEAFEVDPYRVYADFHSRYDHALVHMEGLSHVVYHPRPFCTQTGAYDLAILLFPFVFAADHLEWGLPGGYFEPDRLLREVWESLKPGGLLWIVNQGEEEHIAEKANLERAGIHRAAAFSFVSNFYQYDLSRWGLVACRDD